MGGAPEESEEQKRARKAAERRARRDRIIQNQEFLTDRTATLRRRFGLLHGNFGGSPSLRGPAQNFITSLGASLIVDAAKGGSLASELGRGIRRGGLGG